MKFIWAREVEEEFNSLVFSIKIEKKCDVMYICAVDEYSVFIDGQFVCYGPNRTARGYVHPTKLQLQSAKLIEIKVTSYKTGNFAVDKQEPFFAAELKNGDLLVYDSSDFVCYKPQSRSHNVTRYSRQRGYLEIYDLKNKECVIKDTVDVQAPILLDIIKDNSDYHIVQFNKIKEGKFTGFDCYDHKPWWYNIEGYAPSEKDFNTERDFLEYALGFNCVDYVLPNELTGFIKLNIDAEDNTDIFVAFEEVMLDGKWKFYRSANNDYIKVSAPKGKTEFVNAQPYVMKYLKIIYNGKASIKPELITLENSNKACVSLKGNDKFVKIFDSAINTFRQNAVDIFTDCPGRERGGYLCDSFFTAKAERFLFNNNDIEKNFLNNFLLAQTEELPDGMLPMCYPAEHDKDFYIPNWAMWFNLEICDYYKRTKDRNFVDRAKDKVYGIIQFFQKYFNEFGLLENLESWVFVEWSICNDPEYIKGVNFPSNMLFAKMIKEVGALYQDNSLIAQSNKMFDSILKLSYNGKFFVDNAIRENAVLTPCDNHLSETCQYYALFSGLNPDNDFSLRMINDFGPLNKEYPNNIGKSNMFIGHYLRFMWLIDIGQKDRLLQETIPCFINMAQKTGTLWEKDESSASCCHGFTSVIAMFMIYALTDFNEYDDLKKYNGKQYNKDYDVTITFDYK